MMMKQCRIAVVWTCCLLFLPTIDGMTDIVEVVLQATNFPNQPPLDPETEEHIVGTCQPIVELIVNAAFQANEPEFLNELAPGEPIDEAALIVERRRRRRSLLRGHLNETFSLFEGNATTEYDRDLEEAYAYAAAASSSSTLQHRLLPSSCPSSNKCFGRKWKLCRRLGCPYKQVSRRRRRLVKEVIDNANTDDPHFAIQEIATAINNQMRVLSRIEKIQLIVVIKRLGL